MLQNPNQVRWTASPEINSGNQAEQPSAQVFQFPAQAMEQTPPVAEATTSPEVIRNEALDAEVIRQTGEFITQIREEELRRAA